MRGSSIFGAVAALLLAAAPLAAQEESADALAARALTITSRHDWDALARLIDPAELQRVQSVFGRLMETEPDPSVFAMFDVTTPEEFMALSPHEVMLSFLQIAEVQQQLRSVEIKDGRVIGIVREGEDQAHAVVRQTVSGQGFEISGIDIISMRRRDGAWWLQMGPELEGLLIGLEAGLKDAGY